MSTIRNASILAVAVSMAVSGQVNAQRSTTTEIEEVVVTAQKREENMQDVAISMSAMDANDFSIAFASIPQILQGRRKIAKGPSAMAGPMHQQNIRHVQPLS